MDWITLSKFLPKLIAPGNLVLWSVVISLVSLFFRMRKTALSFLLFPLAIVVFASSPVVGNLYAKIDRAYLPVPIDQSPQADAIVLLAGDISPPIPPRVESQIRGNRALHTARLYRAGKAPLILVSGGNVFTQKGIKGEAHYTKEILIEWGIPESAIMIEAGSRNTYENALEAEKILRKEDLGTILLATSSFHMPRALATFRMTGLNVIPSTTGIGAFEAKPRVLEFIDLLPSLSELGRLERVMREYLGIAMYCYRGWLNCDSLFKKGLH